MKNKGFYIFIFSMMLVLLIIGIIAYCYEVTADYQNILIGISAVLTPLLGILGFKEWRSELHGKTKFGIAREAIAFLDKLQDAIIETRSFSVPNDLLFSEWLKKNEWDGKLIDPWITLYEDKMSVVRQEFDKLYGMRGECRALFKSNISSRLLTLKKCVVKLEDATRSYFQLSYVLYLTSAPDLLKQFKQQEDILFSKDVGDEYGDELTSIIDSLIGLLSEEAELKV